MTWSPSQYGQFENERNRPIRDLLSALSIERVDVAVDLGCGPGNSTELLQQRYVDAIISGIDSDVAMIEAARQRLPNVSFQLSDIASWKPERNFDLILANASLQWLPDHEVLLPSLLQKLRAGGQLAVQMPDNLDEPAHRLMREVAAQQPWQHQLANASNARAPRREAAWYYRVLREHSASVDVWRTVYHHPLAGGAAAIVEWFKGSGLRPFVQALDEHERSDYLARYQAEIALAYSAQPDGSVLLPFPRLFFIATR
jgi:trans-aconitate 2-methyltransferase